MDLKHFLMVLLLAPLLPITATAEQHSACNDAGALAPSAAPDLLRNIAASCAAAVTADLYYNRAYHAELLGRYRAAMRLQGYRRQEDVKNYHTYRIFIGLSEAMASAAPLPGDGDTVAWLNSVYDRATEIAEMRLRGYDQQANRLESEFWVEGSR